MLPCATDLTYFTRIGIEILPILLLLKCQHVTERSLAAPEIVLATLMHDTISQASVRIFSVRIVRWSICAENCAGNMCRKLSRVCIFITNESVCLSVYLWTNSSVSFAYIRLTIFVCSIGVVLRLFSPWDGDLRITMSKLVYQQYKV